MPQDAHLTHTLGPQRRRLPGDQETHMEPARRGGERRAAQAEAPGACGPPPAGTGLCKPGRGARHESSTAAPLPAPARVEVLAMLAATAPTSSFDGRPQAPAAAARRWPRQGSRWAALHRHASAAQRLQHLARCRRRRWRWPARQWLRRGSRTGRPRPSLGRAPSWGRW